MSVTLALAALAALLATAAAAEPFPSRLGTSGLLDVEDASVLGPGGTALGVELRLDHAPGVERALGPSPVTVGFGLGYGVEAALALREGGLPGDPRPSPLLFAGAVKLQIFAGEGYTPSVAVQASVDRVNLQAQGAADLVVSAGNGGLLRLAALAGVEDRDELGFGPMGPRGGGAVAVRGPARTELVVQALAHPGGAVFGGALRWAMSEQGGLALAAQWQPGDSGLRVSLGFGFSTAGRAAARKAAAKEELAPAPAVQAGAPAAPVFHDALPRLRLKVKRGEVPGDDDGRHLQPAPPEAAPDAPASPSKQDKTENGQRPRTAGPRRTIAARAHAAPPRKIAVAELVLAPPPPPPPPPPPKPPPSLPPRRCVPAAPPPAAPPLRAQSDSCCVEDCDCGDAAAPPSLEALVSSMRRQSAGRSALAPRELSPFESCDCPEWPPPRVQPAPPTCVTP